MEQQLRRFYLLGDPVSHSLSPALFAAAFAARGLPAAYEARAVPPARLAVTLASLVGEGASGFNLTVPHKRAVMGLLDEVEPLAARVGAVNAVTVSRGRTRGHNTDLSGFAGSLARVGAPPPRGARVLLLGAGGAARAVAFALGEAGAGEVLIANRTLARAAELASLAGQAFPSTRFLPLPWREGEVPEGGDGAALCVQATSLGLSAADPLPLEPSLLASSCFCYDLVYGPAGTAWVHRARAAGRGACDGKEMLLGQAAEAWRLWWGDEPPLAAMREALERGLARAPGGYPDA